MFTPHFPLKKACMLLLATVMVAGASLYTPLKSSALTKEEVDRKVAQYEQKQAELKRKIKAIEGDKSRAEDLQESLQAQIDNTQEEIDYVNNTLSQLSADIAKNEKEIQQKETYLNETKQLLKSRLYAIYITGGGGQLEVLLGAEDYANYLSYAELMRGVTAHDTALMNQITADIKAVREKKAETEEKKTQAQGLKSTLSGKQRELDAQYASARKTIGDLNAQKGNLAAQAEEAEKEKAKIRREWEEVIRSKSNPKLVYSGDLAWPFQSSYYISSPFGPRGYGTHTGVDITCGGAYGKPIYAAADGQVIFVKYSNVSYGNHLIIDHGVKNGSQFSTLYAHCSSIAVGSGATVKRGQVIAYVGSTGNSTGPHLHFEIRVNGSAVNPMNYYAGF